jgi:hypothetical protein
VAKAFGGSNPLSATSISEDLLNGILILATFLSENIINGTLIDITVYL